MILTHNIIMITTCLFICVAGECYDVVFIFRIPSRSKDETADIMLEQV